MVTPAVRREAVAHLQVTYTVSERRACSALGADRTSMRYRSRRPDDMAVRARLRELASVRRRFGYRRLHILLRREGGPHSSVGNLAPSIYAAFSAPKMQRDGTLRYAEGSAPHPVASPGQSGSNQPGTLLISG